MFNKLDNKRNQKPEINKKVLKQTYFKILNI